MGRLTRANAGNQNVRRDFLTFEPDAADRLRFVGFRWVRCALLVFETGRSKVETGELNPRPAVSRSPEP